MLTLTFLKHINAGNDCLMVPFKHKYKCRVDTASVNKGLIDLGGPPPCHIQYTVSTQKKGRLSAQHKAACHKNDNILYKFLTFNWRKKNITIFNTGCLLLC